MDLNDIRSPRDLDKMNDAELKALAQTLRAKIVRTVSEHGGHLASNLGVVELTIALHRAFSCPRDKIIFDVGHQCYPHKLLTGRAAQFDTLRMLDGLCGFPRHEESEYDAYDTGHASTAISAALGMARARDLKGEDYNVVAVVGDGAMTGGMCYEALNDAGCSQTRIIVILNDNGMSISGNVGALSNYLTYLRVSKGWLTIKRAISSFLLRIPFCGKALHNAFQRFKDSIRNVFVRDKFFSSLGFRYLGPIDGQDIEGLERVLTSAKAFDEPVLIHVSTKKGCGYAPAESMPEMFHGTPPFRVDSGLFEESTDAVSFGKSAADTLMELAQTDERVVAVTAAMTDGTGFSEFKKKYPNRLFDVGIAEEHAVTMAAGLARGGMRPAVAIYDTFLQRGFDQVVEDVCMQNLPVLLLLDRAALSGHDGATHHGVFGLSYLCPIPNLTVLCPRCVGELRQMIHYAFSIGGPVAIRYPRAEEPLAKEYPYDGPFVLGKWETLEQGTDCALLCVGPMTDTGIKTARILRERGISAQVINASSVKPLDSDFLRAMDIPCFTLEEHVLSGGLGSRVAAFCAQMNKNAPRALFSLPDKFIAHGDRRELLHRCGLDENTLASRICAELKGAKQHENAR